MYVKISIGSAHAIITYGLRTRKFSVRWITRSRINNVLQFLNKFDADFQEFLFRLVTREGTWIYQSDLEFNIQSKQ